MAEAPILRRRRHTAQVGVARWLQQVWVTREGRVTVRVGSDGTGGRWMVIDDWVVVGQRRRRRGGGWLTDLTGPRQTQA